MTYKCLAEVRKRMPVVLKYWAIGILFTLMSCFASALVVYCLDLLSACCLVGTALSPQPLLAQEF
jgi:hypothetical protein